MRFRSDIVISFIILFLLYGISSTMLSKVSKIEKGLSAPIEIPYGDRNFAIVDSSDNSCSGDLSVYLSKDILYGLKINTEFLFELYKEEQKLVASYTGIHNPLGQLMSGDFSLNLPTFSLSASLKGINPIVVSLDIGSKGKNNETKQISRSFSIPGPLLVEDSKTKGVKLRYEAIREFSSLFSISQILSGLNNGNRLKLVEMGKCEKKKAASFTISPRELESLGELMDIGQ